MDHIYFSLCHFNDSIIRLMLQETGYSCLNEFELFTPNPKFEMIWNSKKGLFETNKLFYTDNCPIEQDIYVRNVPMSSLCLEIKNYIYGYFLINSQYHSFEDYYISNYRQLDDIRIWVPYKRKVLNDQMSCYEAFKSLDTECVKSESTYKDDFDKILEEINSVENNQYVYVRKLKPLEGFNYHYIFTNSGKSRRMILLDPYSNKDFESSIIDIEKYLIDVFNGENIDIKFKKSGKSYLFSTKYADVLTNLGAKKISKMNTHLKE